MSEEFETWFYASKYAKVINPRKTTKQAALDGWNAATEQMQAKLDAQAKDIEALRGFAKRILAQAKLVDANKVLDFAKELNLVDETGHPTPLLMGDK